MITRIKIDGFKSLLNTELYFGPFTCIAGANAVGKSNFFDALLFLSKLADGKSLLEAAKSIRSESDKHSEIKEIFFKNGEDFYDKISFEVDMLVPLKAEDDLGQEAEASITSLRYILELKLNLNIDEKEPIEISKEELKPITQAGIKKKLFFSRKKDWVESVVQGRRPQDLISTDGSKIRLHQDGSKGRTTEFIAEKMPRTLLSTVTAESPTAFLARHEMRNWIMLQFEPSALRKPNTTYEVRNAEITANGSNMPATLYRLHTEKKEQDVYQVLTNKLKNLVSDIDEIKVDKDEKRDLLTLQVKYKDGLILPAQSLSDGTLRFLGLAIIKEDSKSSGLICLEEPENGINPKKVEEMVKLLEEMAVDTDFEIDDENPLRQVIINSHSPLVVSKVSDESLYLAIEREMYSEVFKRKIRYTSFSAPKGTWKTNNELANETTLGEIISYLDNSYNSLPANVSDYRVTYSKSNNSRRTLAENINQLYLFNNE
ncbi:MAG: AAA family ATPase [Cytophagales bacterium]